MNDRSSVLIIDDDPSFRTLVRSILEVKKDYTVLEAEGVDDGLALAIKDPPQLIILDLMMPHKPGQEFLVSAKNDEAIKHIPILVCTGRGNEMDSRRCRMLGAADVISKPFDMEDLRYKVRKAIGH